MVSPVGDDFFVVTNSVRPLLFIYPHIRYPHNVWHIVYHMARLHNLVIPQNLIALQTGCRGRQPLQLLRAKSLCSVLGHNYGRLCQFLIPNSSFLIKILVHNYGQLCQFLTPHSSLNRKLPIFNGRISDLSHLVPVMRVMVIQASHSKEPACFRSLYALDYILINHAIL